MLYACIIISVGFFNLKIAAKKSMSYCLFCCCRMFRCKYNSSLLSDLYIESISVIFGLF